MIATMTPYIATIIYREISKPLATLGGSQANGVYGLGKIGVVVIEVGRCGCQLIVSCLWGK